MIERRTLQLDGIRLSYLEQGTATQGAPSLVLMHGLMGCAATFIPFMQEFAPSQHIIALDFPGSGESERRNHIDAALPATTHLVAEFIAALQLARPVLLGHSHGGTVAMSVAAQHRDLLRSLVLIAPAHPYFDEGDPLIRFYLSIPGRLFAYSMPWYPQWMQMMGLRRMAGPQSWDTPSRLKPYRDNLRTPGTMKHLLKLLGSWTVDMAQLGESLQTPIDIPTCFIWGDHDRAVPIDSSEALLPHFKQWDLFTLPGVGHRPAEEVAATCARLVSDQIAFVVAPKPLVVEHTVTAQTLPQPSF